MDVMSMKKAAAVLMVIALLAGATLLFHDWVRLGLPVLPKAAVGVFVVVALAIAWINLNFHSKLVPLPRGSVLVHSVVALAAFALLVLALASQP
jgi:hypothetical protein